MIQHNTDYLLHNYNCLLILCTYHLHRYTKKSDGTVKMHRSVSSDDVVSYSSDIPQDEVDLSKEEDVEVKSGKIMSSSGTTSVKMLSKKHDKDIVGERPGAGKHPMRGERQTAESDDTYDGSFSANEFRGHGSYSLKLKKCYRVKSARGRRDVEQFMMGDGFTTSSLRAKHNESKRSY